MPTPITLQTFIHQGIYVIECQGEFDETNVDTQFEKIFSFLDNLKEKKFVIMDLGGVSYVNSKFIGYVADISNRLEEYDGKMFLADTSKIRDTLEICGLHQIIDLYDTRDDAQEYLLHNHGEFLQQKALHDEQEQEQKVRDHEDISVSPDAFFESSSEDTPSQASQGSSDTDSQDTPEELQDVSDGGAQGTSDISSSEVDPESGDDREDQTGETTSLFALSDKQEDAQETIHEQDASMHSPSSESQDVLAEQQQDVDFFSGIQSGEAHEKSQQQDIPSQEDSEKSDEGILGETHLFAESQDMTEDTEDTTKQQDSEEASSFDASTSHEAIFSSDDGPKEDDETKTHEGADISVTPDAQDTGFFFSTDTTPHDQGSQADGIQDTSVSPDQAPQDTQMEHTLFEKSEDQTTSTEDTQVPHEDDLAQDISPEVTRDEQTLPDVDPLQQVENELLDIKARIEELQEQGRQLYRKKQELLAHNDESGVSI